MSATETPSPAPAIKKASSAQRFLGTSDKINLPDLPPVLLNLTSDFLQF